MYHVQIHARVRVRIRTRRVQHQHHVDASRGCEVARACVGDRSSFSRANVVREKARKVVARSPGNLSRLRHPAPSPPPSRAIRLSPHRPVIIASQWRRPLIMFHNTSYPHSNIHSLKGSSSFIYIIFIPRDNAGPLGSLPTACTYRPPFAGVLSVSPAVPRETRTKSGQFRGEIMRETPRGIAGTARREKLARRCRNRGKKRAAETRKAMFP